MTLSIKKPNARLTREEWLARALDVLAKEGGARLRIERLVDALGVTKGSFYWHFADRREFQHALVDYWDRHFTARVAAEVSEVSGGPEERLRALTALVIRENLGRYDVAVRAWAAQDAEVARLVAKVYAFRLRYVSRLFEEIGFRGNELRARTHTFAAYMSLEIDMLRGTAQRRRLAQAEEVLRMLVSQ